MVSLLQKGDTTMLADNVTEILFVLAADSTMGWEETGETRLPEGLVTFMPIDRDLRREYPALTAEAYLLFTYDVADAEADSAPYPDTESAHKVFRTLAEGYEAYLEEVAEAVEEDENATIAEEGD
jgi:hypothetical protein